MRTLIILVFLAGVFHTKFQVLAVRAKLYQTPNNVTYFINQDYTYTWFEALIECSSRNMSLLTLEEDVELLDIYQIAIKNNFAKKPPHLWTGGVGSNRKFIWFSTGTPVATRTWGIGNPDNSGNVENCVQIFENTNKLNDIKCFEKMGFVCEKKPGNDEEKPLADFGKFGDWCLILIKENNE
ncbi:lectin subunit alpha-like precursor [Musca domestica]|uniref:Lectin subunit alpha-like precursor n=1 Tax=Musca domestica TaxID=7370 RepID=A0A088SR08_MUSDO|nr:lectin subunit alpha-like precursor [Musca domestica]AIO05900.1 macrophage mannose receptor 1-like protein [Musca domestica]